MYAKWLEAVGGTVEEVDDQRRKHELDSRGRKEDMPKICAANHGTHSGVTFRHTPING